MSLDSIRLTALGGSLLGGILSNTTWLVHANAIVGIMAGVGSLAGLWWFIQMQRAVIRLKLAEAKHEELRICAECARGVVPESCPMKNGGAPASCPFRQREYLVGLLKAP